MHLVPFSVPRPFFGVPRPQNSHTFEIVNKTENRDYEKARFYTVSGSFRCFSARTKADVYCFYPRE